MLKYKKVLRTNIFYEIGYYLSKFWYNFVFYKKTEVVDSKKIPKKEMVIIGPNHQNALMDPLTILYAANHSPAFLARSDLFKTKFLSNLMLFFRILPIYRIRDGKENLSKNKDTFNYSVEVVKNNKPLVLFPEARHTDKRSIMPMKKGLSRIVLMTAADTNFERDIYVVPAGIYYSNYTNYRGKLLTQFGDPINAKKYKEVYQENPEKAFSELRYEVQEKVIPLAIHIKNKEYYDQYEDARDIFDYSYAKKNNLKIKKLSHKFKADKAIIAKIDDLYEKDENKFKNFAQKITDYTKNLKNYNYRDYLMDKPLQIFKYLLLTLLSIVLLPINLLSFIYFAIPVLSPEFLVKKFKDPQFHSSVRFAGSFFLSQIWAVIGFILLWIYTGHWWIGLAYVILLPLWLIAWLEMRRLNKKLWNYWRFVFDKEKRNELKKQREELIREFEAL